MGDFYFDNIENEELPYWASGHAHGEFLEGSQLCTRDGRKIGNAVIQKREVVTDDNGNNVFLYHIVTDIGNVLKLYLVEVLELFHRPKYIVKDY